MNNDLISREALKKAVEDLVAGGAERLKDYYENGSKKEENEWIGGVYDAWELICDAPTVEERPKGKWTNLSPFDEEGLCSVCGGCYPSYYRFCPLCGADMRKGGTE